MLRNPLDRDIARLAIPSLGALAAEPLYVLVDTAIVGHIGTRELAALALAATVLSGVAGLCNFLAYGTTAQVARAHGSGDRLHADALAAQALWLAVGVGLFVALLCVVAADPVMHVLGGTGATAELAARYLRIGAIGLPCVLIALAGQGYLRGVERLRTPLLILLVANLANVVLEVVLVYGFDLGLDGSAVGTVIAQLGMAGAFVVLLWRAAPSHRPDLARLRSLAGIGRDIFIRTASLIAAFTLASAIVAREGAAPLGAQQIAFQLFVFLALVLDAIAIAGQILSGQLLGAGDAAAAKAAAQRMIGWSLVVGGLFAVALLATSGVVPRAFTDDDAVVDAARSIWPLFALMLIPGAVVFALDGILIGAGDTRYIARAMFGAFALFAPLAVLTAVAGWGIVGMWCALNVLMLSRLVAMATRYRGGRWLVTGA